MYDICIIGAGVVGTAIARELSKFKLSVCILEKGEDVATGATKANSGIVHGGYNEKHGSIKAKFSLAGNRMFTKLNSELHFGFSKCGSLLIGFDENDVTEINKIYQNGLKNGVTNLEIVDGNFIRQKEPHLNPAITSGLYCPEAGITSPYEFAIALAENAIENGVQLKLGCEVTSIEDQGNHFLIMYRNSDTVIYTTANAKIIINAAGLYADDVARMVGCDEFTINPKQGQYLLFDKDQGYLTNSVIFQVPTPETKGVLVTRTLHGNLLIGPDATTIDMKHCVDTHDKNIHYVKNSALRSVTKFDWRKAITSFSGNRATPSTGDFIVSESKIKRFINVAGIESPGLTAAPAIAVYIAELLQEIGIKMEHNEKFNPNRRPYYNVAEMSEEELQELIKKDPRYGKIVCRCETISEGEIVDALHRPIPINSLDAIKRRTRAGMGRCQAGFCTPKIMEIICNELNIPASHVQKKGPGSMMVMGKTK